MLTAITRYGVRVPPHTDEIIERCTARGEVTQGPLIDEFERAFESRLGSGTAIATSYGRMAFFHILRALDLPAGSEIIVPALDVLGDSRARSPGRTASGFCRRQRRHVHARSRSLRARDHAEHAGGRADASLRLAVRHGSDHDLARQHNIAVIEDCAHALGATYRGRPVGTFGDGALFSFQTIKPLNAFGGGMALVKDPEIARRVRDAGRRAAVARTETD